MRPPASMTRYLSSACASGAGAGVGLAATFVPQAVTAAARHSDKSARLIPLRNDAWADMFPRRYGACSSDGMGLWHGARPVLVVDDDAATRKAERSRSEEHTSELQSRGHLVCRLLLEKKNTVAERGSHD